MHLTRPAAAPELISTLGARSPAPGSSTPQTHPPLSMPLRPQAAGVILDDIPHHDQSADFAVLAEQMELDARQRLKFLVSCTRVRVNKRARVFVYAHVWPGGSVPRPSPPFCVLGSVFWGGAGAEGRAVLSSSVFCVLWAGRG